MSSAQKKVIVRRFVGPLAWGYLPQNHPVRPGSPDDPQGPHVELIDPAARVTPLPLKQIKWIAYVRDFNLADTVSPEGLDRRRFATRPRTEGLWVRLRFHDGDTLEGLVQINPALLESLGESQGLFLTPPDTRANTQRLFIPRLALQAIEPLGLILPASAKSKPTASTPQPTLFP